MKRGKNYCGQRTAARRHRRHRVRQHLPARHLAHHGLVPSGRRGAAVRRRLARGRQAGLLQPLDARPRGLCCIHAGRSTCRSSRWVEEGYTVRNVARTWTYETGLLVGQRLDEDLAVQRLHPVLWARVQARGAADPRWNLDNLRTKVIDNLRQLPSAPGVQMQEVPRTTLNPADVEVSDDEDSDLDERISQRLRDAHVQNWDDELSDDEDAHGVSAWEAATSRRSSTVSNGRRKPGIMDPIRPFEHDLGLKYVAQNGAGAAKGKGRTKRTFFAARAAKPVLADLHLDEDDADSDDDDDHRGQALRQSTRSVRSRLLANDAPVVRDATPLSDDMGSPALSTAAPSVRGRR
ncbi:hypothetical protein L1887_62334 [Cichorium endivia]|nr:hypothetical protein L1887_62334 [Cichorium endivia]